MVSQLWKCKTPEEKVLVQLIVIFLKLGAHTALIIKNLIQVFKNLDLKKELSLEENFTK
jgi:hypothetical protein